MKVGDKERQKMAKRKSGKRRSKECRARGKGR